MQRDFPRFPTTNRSGVAIKPHQVWQRPNVDAQRAEVLRVLADIEARSGRAEALAAAVSEAEALDSEPSLQGQLHAFLYACAALDLHARGGGLDGEAVAALYRRALSVLSRHGIRPATSRVAHLYGELHATMCRVAALEGRAWSAAWRHFLAKYEGGVVPDHADLFRQVSLDLQLGLGESALARLLDAELPETPAVALATLRLARARIHRLTGDLDGAASILEQIGVDEADAPAIVRETLWEGACIESQRTSSLEPQARLSRVRRDARTPRRLLDLFLWSRATHGKKWMSAAPKASSLKKTGSTVLDPVVLRCALAIERCYDGKGALTSRVSALGRALEDADRIAELDQQMLVWAAAGRWLFRAKKPDLAALPLARYRALSLGLTLGHDGDVLRAAGDIPLDETTACSLDDFRFPEASPEPPTSVVRRNLALSRMAMAMARAGGSGLANRALGRDGAGREHLLEYAEIAARYMGQLKGPIMKIGQLLSYYGFDVPEEVTATLATLQDASTHLATERVLSIVEEELGMPAAEAFARFEPRPIATGSLGQVHRAELADGRRVAVKVQYPNAERIVRSDLSSLALAKPFLRVLLARWDVDGLLRELGERMIEECDYRREAESQRYFRELLADEPAMHVPEPIDTHTTSRVLTSELAEGMPFAEFCARASQADRDRAGVTIMRFVMKTVLADRSFNSDMHPGNLLFSRGRVHFLDFGNVRRWSEPGEGSGWQAIIEAVLAEDLDAFRRAMLSLELVREEDRLDFAWAFEILSGRLLRCIVVDAPTRFEIDAVRRDIEMFFLDHPEASKLRVPPRYLYGFRIYWGMFAVLTQLRAEANWRRVAEDALRELTPRSAQLPPRRNVW